MYTAGSGGVPEEVTVLSHEKGKIGYGGAWTEDDSRQTTLRPIA